MTPPVYEVQIAGLAGQNWKTVCRAPEEKAREVFELQLRIYTVGRFRLLDAGGAVIEDRRARLLFSDN